MNKILRYSFIALLAFVCQVSFAAAYKTLSFPDDNKDNNQVNNYTETWIAKKGNDSWTITNFNNYQWNGWTYIKCGSKKAASIATIATDFAIDKAMSTVVVTIDKVTAANVNSISLVVSSDADGSNVLETVKAGTIAAGDLTFTIKTPTANSYYKLVFDCAKSSNGLVQVSKVEYFEKAEATTYTDVASVKDLLANYTADTKNLNLTLTDAKVLYVNNYNGTVNTYVREGESAIELRTLGFDMPVGSVINGTVKVNLIYSYGVPYLTANTATDDENLSIAESTVAAEPIVATIADLNANKYLNDLVVIKDAKFSAETSGTRTNYFVVDGDAKVQLYDKFQVSNLTKLTDGNTYTVQGIFGAIYNEVPEILMTENVNTTPTNINGIAADAATVNAPAYNLAGQKVSAAYKGVVIKAGKKFVQK